MSDKKKLGQNAQAGNEDREQLRSMIDDREREYELQMDVQAQLIRIQEELRDLDSQLGNLIANKSDPDFIQNQADLLKGLVVLDEELSELEEEVGDDVLKRIGSLYVSVKKQSKEMIKWANSGGLEGRLESMTPRPENKAKASPEEAAPTDSPKSPAKNPGDELNRKGRITSITIENFKGIGEKVTIPLKPITLLFGANSAGKSTVLQAMQVVYELLKNQRKFYANGERIGSFFDLVHNHDLKQKIKVGFEVQLDDDGIGIDEIDYVDSFYVEFELGANWCDKKMDLFFDGELFCSADISDGIQFSLKMDHALCQAARKEYGEDCYDPYFWVDENGVRDTQEISGNLFSRQEGASPIMDHELGWINISDEIYGEIDIDEAPEFFGFLKGFIIPPLEFLLQELDALRHVGPIREIPASGLNLGQIEESSWFNGLAAWKIGLDEFKWHSPDPELGPEDDHSSEYFVRTVNGLDWFEYALAIQGQAEFKLSPEIYTSLSKHDISEEERSQQLLQGLKEVYGDAWHHNAIRDTLILRHKASGVIVDPSAVGTGISQVFPVIAAAIAEKAQFVLIEQPELHIHPRVQCELGDLFISQSKRYPERTFLLETHSEHLILRLLRRIRETSAGELQDQSLALTPEEVGVLYVEETDSGVTIKELPITPDGDFSEKWPRGFFEERAEELF